MHKKTTMTLNKPKITEDIFTKSKVIDWEYVAGRKPRGLGFEFEDGIVTGAENDNFSKLIFSPINKDGINYLKLRFQKKFFNPQKGDSISFLFEDDNIEVFIIDKKPIEIMDHTNWGKILETLIPISLSQLDTFASKKFVSWKHKSGNKELVFEDGIAHDSFRPIETLQKSISNLFKEFNQILISEDLYFEGEQKIESELPCFVYLMNDLVNGAYKIGISNSPEYRERTLQSEKPDIKLIHSKQFPKRSIAEVFEKVLHEHFRNKRIRGEWFQLSNDDIIDLKIILN